MGSCSYGFSLVFIFNPMPADHTKMQAEEKDGRRQEQLLANLFSSILSSCFQRTLTKAQVLKVGIFPLCKMDISERIHTYICMYAHTHVIVWFVGNFFCSLYILGSSNFEADNYMKNKPACRLIHRCS